MASGMRTTTRMRSARRWRRSSSGSTIGGAPTGPVDPDRNVSGSPSPPSVSPCEPTSGGGAQSRPAESQKLPAGSGAGAGSAAHNLTHLRPRGHRDELVPVRRPPRSSGGGALGMIAAIIAFGLLGLGLRAVPMVLTGDLLALAAAPAGRRPRRVESASPPPRTPTAVAVGTPTPGPRPSRQPKPRPSAAEVDVPATGPGTYRAAGRRPAGVE